MSTRYPTGGRKPWLRQTVRISRAGGMNVYGERGSYVVRYEAVPAKVDRQVAGLMPELRAIGAEVEDLIRAIVGSEVELEYGDLIEWEGRGYTVKKINPIYDHRGGISTYEVLALVLRNG